MLKTADPVIARQMTEVLSGTNLCQSPLVSFEVRGCRMSGDMCTSLGNGFTNLMVMLFLARENGSTVRGFVEGDDGLFTIKGEVPTLQQYAALGFNVKLSMESEINMASFCGQVYGRQSREIVVDPVYECLNIGWTTADQRHGKPLVLRRLLRAKAISLAYYCPRCPIVQSLTRAILRLTRGVDALFPTMNGNRDWWMHRLIGDVRTVTAGVERRLSTPPDAELRQMVSDLYGFSSDDQITLERYFDSWTELGPWSHPLLDARIPDVYRRYYEGNTFRFEIGSVMSAPFDCPLDFITNVDVRGKSARSGGDRRFPYEPQAVQNVFAAAQCYGRLDVIVPSPLH